MGIDDPLQDDASDPFSSPRRSNGGETILVVEDNSSLRVVLRRGLEMYGFNVVEAAGPAEAIALSTSHRGRLDVLLIDVIMPEMHGPDLARVILRDHPNASIIYMSAYRQELSDEEWTEEPVRLIEKPFRISDLANVLSRELDSRPPPPDDSPTPC